MSLPTIYGLSDFQQIIAAAYGASAGTPANIGTGSQFGPSFNAVSLAMLLLQNEIVYVDSIARLSTIPDPLPNGDPNPDVDSFINQFGFYRNQSSQATGYCTFSIPSVSAQDTVVTIGVTVSPSGGPPFVVVPGGSGYSVSAQGYVIPAGQLSVNALVQCTVAGVIGNVGAGTIVQVIVGPGTPGSQSFSVTNADAFTDAQPIESGSPVKQRFALYISGGGEGTPNSILAAVGAVEPGLTYSYCDYLMSVYTDGAWVLTPNVIGWFTIVANVAGSGTTPPTSLLTAIYNALLYQVRAAGIYYNVIPPTLVTVSGTGTIVVATGYDNTTVTNAVNTAFMNFVNNIGLDLYGATTVCGYLNVGAALLQVPGVSRIDGMQLNGGTVDVSAGAGSQLVAGAATFAV